MKSTVLVSAVAFLPSAALAFVAPPPPPPFSFPSARPSPPQPPTPITRVVALSSFITEMSTKEQGEWSIGAPSRQMLEAARRKQVARNALGKLLERQQRDMQQTLDGIGDDVFVREDRRRRREDIDDASSSSSSSIDPRRRRRRRCSVRGVRPPPGNVSPWGRSNSRGTCSL